MTVKVKPAGMEVRSRLGFVGEEDKLLPPLANLPPREQLARALSAPFQTAEIPVKLTGLFAVDADKKPYLHCLLHVGIESLAFTKGDDGKLHADLDLVIAGFDGNGDSPHNSYKSVPVTIDPAKQQEAFQKGIFVVAAYPLQKPGPYQLRAAIRDRARGTIGSASQFVMAPDLSKGKLELSSVVLASGTNTTDRMRLATRVFQPGEEVDYSVQVINAKPGAKLSAQVRLFEEGEQLFESDPAPLANPQAATGAIRLNSKIRSGDYALQVVITDSSGSKPQQLSQWTDLHVKAN